MAANYLTVNTQFNPYTLQEMLVPYQMYGEEYRRREDLQNQYSDAADVLGAYLDMERDKEAYAAYNAYKNALDAAATDLSTNGLSAANRKSLNNLRRRYNTEITPISAAIESRQNYIKDYDALRAKDPTLLSSINPSAVSVDAFLNGKTPERLDVYGSQIYSRMEAQAKAASQRMQYDPQFFKTMEDQYWAIKQRKGFNSYDTQRFLQDMMSIPELGTMIDSVMQSTGAYNLPEAERNKAFQYAVEGTLAGMTGDVDYGFQDNKCHNFEGIPDQGQEKVFPSHHISRAALFRCPVHPAEPDHVHGRGQGKEGRSGGQLRYCHAIYDRQRTDRLYGLFFQECRFAEDPLFRSGSGRAGDYFGARYSIEDRIGVRIFPEASECGHEGGHQPECEHCRGGIPAGFIRYQGA